MEISTTGSGHVELGFLASPESGWRIFDSAKFGGKPFWFIPTHIPTFADIKCKCCEKAMCFMVQLYVPCDDIVDAWHRCIYVFVCRNQKCIEKGCMKVLRCQLPQKNEFYPENADDDFIDNYYNEEKKSSPFHYENHLCDVCGIKATSKCSNCSVYYCCKDHQISGWKNGHKEVCKMSDKSLTAIYDDSIVCPGIQFPLWEVEIYPEPEQTREELAAEAAELTRFDKFKVADGPVTMTEEDIRDALGGRMENDPVRFHFNKVMERANTQVLRISQWHNEDILWANGATRLSLDEVPCCPYCGAKRKFELQIMPQLIYLLGSNSSSKAEYPEIDFGSLVVFTCCESCSHILLLYYVNIAFTIYQRKTVHIWRSLFIITLTIRRRILKKCKNSYDHLHLIRRRLSVVCLPVL